MRQLIPLAAALAALLLVAGFPRARWIAAVVLMLVLVYLVLKLSGLIDSAEPSRSGVL